MNRGRTFHGHHGPIPNTEALCDNSDMSINIIQKAFTGGNRKESVIRHDSSPVKTVLGENISLMVRSSAYSSILQEV